MICIIYMFSKNALFTQMFVSILKNIFLKTRIILACDIYILGFSFGKLPVRKKLIKFFGRITYMGLMGVELVSNDFKVAYIKICVPNSIFKI